MKTDSPLRFYRWLLLCVFIVAELLLLSLDLFYLIVQGESIASFFADFGIVTVIVTVLVLFIYYALKHVLLKYEDAEEALRQTQFTVDHSADSVLWVTPEGKIIFANDEACRRRGYTKEEILSLTMFDINVDFAADNDLWESCVERIQREGHFVAEFRHRTKGGEVFPVEAMLNYYDLEDKWLFVGNVRDITDRKAAEEVLRESEEKYRLLFDNAGEAIFSYDPELRLTEINRVCCEAIGYSREEVLGKNVLELNILHPRDLELAATVISRLFAGENVLKTEYTVIRKDGSERLFSVVGAAIRDPDGNLQSITNMCRDITDRKAAEETLRRSEGKYRLLADSLPEILFEMDLEGNLLYVSMSAFIFQGYTQEEFEKGMTVADVLVDWKKSVADLGTRIEKNIGEASGEYIAIKKDGSTAPVIISSRLVYDNGGKVVGLSGVVTDITEQKKTEEKLKRMNVELHGYAHTVSHDLKNPISNVVVGCGTLQNLLDLPLTDRNITYIKEVAEVIIHGSVKAAAFIDELLLLAESGQVPKEIENVDVDEEVRLIITDKSLQADGVKFDTNDLGTVVASPTHVYQIFSNLIRNAARFTNSDEPRIDILRLPSEEGSVHRFLVKDNGPGIPEEIIDKIFIPFTKDKEKGETGIGLSIVERMVKVYGGDIRAYNDNGACFEFTLKDFTYQAS